LLLSIKDHLPPFIIDHLTSVNFWEGLVVGQLEIPANYSRVDCGCTRPKTPWCPLSRASRRRKKIGASYRHSRASGNPAGFGWEGANGLAIGMRRCSRG